MIRRARPILMLAGLLLTAPVFGQETADPYDYTAHQRLAAEARHEGRPSTALYHIAWLVWLAPHDYTKAAEGLLREDMRLSNAGLPAGSPTATVVILAGSARRELANACGRGVLPSQAARLQTTVLDLVQQAEQSQVTRTENDPVARIAMADLYLTLDDAMRLASAADRDRKPVLQRAVTLGEAVTRALPEAPGAPRLTAAARARLANLTNGPEDWDAAIASGTQALVLDQDDPVLWELMWSLNLRAGHWDEAKKWQQRCQKNETAGSHTRGHGRRNCSNRETSALPCRRKMSV